MEAEIPKLTLAKYIFQQGQAELQKHSLYSAGLAVSHFQDAVELILWTIAKTVDADVKGITFDNYWDRIKTGSANRQGIELPLRACMFELNKARVEFKHRGRLPTEDEAIRFEGYTKEFLAESVKRFFDMEWGNISLVNLVKDSKIKEKLRQAEECINAKDYEGCLARCSEANYLIVGSLSRTLAPNIELSYKTLRIPRTADHEALFLLDGVQMRFEQLKKYVEGLRALVVQTMLRINHAEYTRFRKVTPTTSMAGDGDFYQYDHRRHKADTEDNAWFCFRYVVELALKAQEHLQ